jgi:hypothetical protein
MKVFVTHLKAPWPAGSQPGDVVQFDGDLPAWAVGKCTAAPDDAEVTEHRIAAALADADEHAEAEKKSARKAKA